MTAIRDRTRERLKRQFDSIERRFPKLGRAFRWLRADGSRLVRIPIAILMILGGVFSFLPMLGIWMLPLGLMLLALDLPFLQSPVALAMIRLRRRFSGWLRPRRG